MPTFAYKAIEVKSGAECTGMQEAATSEHAAAALKARGLAPFSLVRGGATETAGEKGSGTRTGQRSSWSRRLGLGQRVGAKSVGGFTRQLATLLRARMPLVRSLEVLARQEPQPAMRRVIERLVETIRAGGTLSEGLRQFPEVFDRLYVSMVAAGEAGGALEVVLDRVAGFMEKSARLRSRVKAAMTYPVVVTVLAAVIVGGLTVFVVPRFEQIFAGLLKGQPLPLLTRAVVGCSAFVQQHAGVLAAAGVAAYFGLRFLRRTPTGEQLVDAAVLRLPLFGAMATKAIVARFARTFGVLLTSGVPMLDALRIARDTSGNGRVEEAIDVVHTRVRDGADLAGPLAATALFPAMMTSMIEVGEETGALPEMLLRIADTYDEEVDTAVAALTSTLEPVLIVGLAGVVGVIVIALFLPIVSIIQYLQ